MTMNRIKDFIQFLKAGWWLFGIIFYPIASCFISMVLMALQIVMTSDMMWLVFLLALIFCIFLELLIYLVLSEE